MEDGTVYQVIAGTGAVALIILLAGWLVSLEQRIERLERIENARDK